MQHKRYFLIIDSFSLILLPREGHVGPLPFKIAGSAPEIKDNDELANEISSIYLEPMSSVCQH